MASTKEGIQINELIDAATQLAVRYITDNNIPFTRGDPSKFFKKLSNLHYGLTLLPGETQITVEHIYLKNMFALWNILVDDEIDNEGKNEHLVQSTLSILSLGGSRSSISEITEMLISPFSTNTALLNIARSDLLQICNGFYYEYCINQNNSLANLFDYDNLSTLTSSLLYYLDIDFTLSNSGNDGYLDLRQAYSYFGKAIKYASDIGSLKREVEKERNLNSILISLMRKGISDIFDPNILKNNLLNEAVSEISNTAQENLAKGTSALISIKIDTNKFQQAVTNVVNNYASGKDF